MKLITRVSVFKVGFDEIVSGEWDFVLYNCIQIIVIEDVTKYEQMPGH